MPWFDPAPSRALVGLIGLALSTAPASPAQAPAKAKPPQAAVKAAASAWPADWPRQVQTEAGLVTVYQPQLEAWDGSLAAATAALSVQPPGQETPTYGVLSFTARTDIDKGERVVTLDEFQVADLRLPSEPAQQERYRAAINKHVASLTRTIDLDRLEASLGILEAQRQGRQQLKNDPPRILFSTRPALLVYVDGPPAWRPLEKTGFERAVNARPLLLRDKKARHFLHVFDGWLEAPAVEGPWALAKKPPKQLDEAKQAAVAAGQVDLLHGGDPKDPKTWPSLKGGRVPPVIHVVTSPTELIVTEGEPNYLPIEKTQLLYVKNTTGNVFKHLADQKTYVLVSGRWFRAATSQGPWEFVANDALPADFAQIPDESPKENVKASVAGTPQAKEALIANSIPQTAQVKRSEAKLTPLQFDGAPELRAIEGTSLQYVANCPTPTIVVGPQEYYAVENGVWFESSSLQGPWAVASTVPAEIYKIPPSSPLHNVTYVKVYKSTPEVVYVGYTPGYYGTCVGHDVVVYGTGYSYTPWVGSWWYGPPVTYGSGVAMTYTPWTGWTVGFGFGWSWGAATVGWGWGTYPWWGPVGWGYYYPYPYYRPYYGGAAFGPGGAAAVWGPGGWAATSGNVYHRWGSTSAVTRSSGGFNAWTGDAWRQSAGMSYNSRTGNLAAGQRSAVGNVYSGNWAAGSRGTVTNTRTGNTVTGGRVAGGNVYSGQSGSAAWVRGENGGVARVGDDLYGAKDGNVYRRGEGGWEQHSGSGSWDRVQDTGRTQQLDRQQQARSSGQARTGSYRSAPRTAGGGGRRR